METPPKQGEKCWYVMRAYKNERKAEELLSGKDGLTHYIPKEQVLRTRHGKKVACMVPVIPGLVFVYATQHQVVAFKRDIYNDLQFVIWEFDTNRHYLIVPDKQMSDFIRLCEQKERKVTFHKPSEIQLEKGTRVRIHGGVLDSVEGTFLKIAGKRRKQVLIILPDMLAASAEVEPEYLEVID